MNPAEIIKLATHGKDEKNDQQARDLAAQADARLRQLDVFNKWRQLPETQIVITALRSHLRDLVNIASAHARFGNAPEVFLRARLVETHLINQILGQTFVDGTLSADVPSNSNETQPS